MGKDAWIWKTTAAIAGAALFLSACSGQGERMTSKAMREQEIEKQEKEVFLAGQTKESPKKTEKAEPGERSETPDKAEPGERSEPSERSESSEKSRGRIGENLGMDPLFLDETYYMAGDVNVTLTAYPDYPSGGDEFAADDLQLFFDEWQTGDGRRGSKALVSLHTEPGKTVYHVRETVSQYGTDPETGWQKIEKEEARDMEISFEGGQPEGTRILVEGDVPFAGIYYRAGAISEIGVRGRYFSPGEVSYLPSENLSLLRNTVYALHGRKFKDPKLQDYFDSQFWYRGRIKPEDFSDEVFNDRERANVKLIQRLEQSRSLPSQKDLYRGPDEKEPAPYLKWLEEGLKEGGAFGCHCSLTGLTLSHNIGLTADRKEAADCGEFWEMDGEIRWPVTLTREQWEQVRKGETVELTVDELTGEKNLLSYDRDTGYLFYRAGEQPVERNTSVFYDYSSGLYYITQDSDDMVMKRVYQGKIRIAKGAVCGANVNLMEASKESQEILLESDTGYGEQFLGGNCLVYDVKGYILALYSLGD